MSNKSRILCIHGKPTSYLVTSNGDVISTNYRRTGKPKMLSQSFDKDGYKIVKITHNGKGYCMKVHRLVAEMFIDNPEFKPQVNHIDGDKSNNNATNLEWVTNGENQKHAYENGLKGSCEDKPGARSSNEQIKEVCMLLEIAEKSISEISDITRVPIKTIQGILYDSLWSGISKEYKIDNYRQVSFRSGNRSHLSKYTKDQIHDVCFYLKDGEKSVREISNITGVKEHMIYNIKYGSCWKEIANEYNLF